MKSPHENTVIMNTQGSYRHFVHFQRPVLKALIVNSSRSITPLTICCWIAIKTFLHHIKSILSVSTNVVEELRIMQY